MIVNFADQTTEDIYHGITSSKSLRVSRALWSVARRKLDMLNAARDIRDLKVPPGNRLEEMKGHYEGLHSIRINEQFRIVFEWKQCNAFRVKIVDYH